MQLYENERIDEVNDRLSLIQKNDGLTFGTDALLLAGYIDGKYKLGAELGGGTGIISMLLLAREKVSSVTAYEVQDEYAELISRNADFNNLSDKLTSVCLDIRKLNTEEVYDIVFTNPPYMKADSGKHNLTDKKSFARHELNGDIADFCNAAKKLLKFGGAFYAVYRPDRLIDIICAMRSQSIEPKRMTFVHADENALPSMVLIEAKRGGKSGIRITKPLIIYKDCEHKSYSEDMESIMENGVFPKEYRRR